MCLNIFVLIVSLTTLKLLRLLVSLNLYDWAAFAGVCVIVWVFCYYLSNHRDHSSLALFVLLYEVVGSLNIATQCALPPRMSPNLGQLNFFMLPLLIFFFIICCYKLAVFGAYFASGFMGTLLGPTFLKIYESV